MEPTVHSFDWPDRVVVGTVGEPGRRTFFLQVRQGERRTEVALEKAQAASLAERLDEVLDELMVSEDNRFSVPPAAPDGLADHEPLEEVLSDRLRVALMTLGWDPSTAQIVLEVHALPVDDDGTIGSPDSTATASSDTSSFGLTDIEDAASDVVVVRMPVGTARAFSERSRRIVASGRPVCQICHEPMMSENDHVCAWDDIR